MKIISFCCKKNNKKKSKYSYDLKYCSTRLLHKTRGIRSIKTLFLNTNANETKLMYSIASNANSCMSKSPEDSPAKSM